MSVPVVVVVGFFVRQGKTKRRGLESRPVCLLSRREEEEEAAEVAAEGKDDVDEEEAEIARKMRRVPAKSRRTGERRR